MVQHCRLRNIVSGAIAALVLSLLSLNSPAVIINLYANNQPTGYSIDIRAGGGKTPFNSRQQPEDITDTELLDWLVGHFSEDDRAGFDEPDDDNLVLGEATTNNIYSLARALHLGDRLVRSGEETINIRKLFVREQPPQLYFKKQGCSHFSSFEGDVQVDPIGQHQIKDKNQRTTIDALIVIRQRLYRTPKEHQPQDLRPSAVVEYAFSRTTGDSIFPAYINIYRPESVGGLGTRLDYMHTAGSAMLFQNQYIGHSSFVDSTTNSDVWIPRKQQESAFDIIERGVLFGLGAAAVPYIGSGITQLAGAVPITVEGLSTTFSSLEIWKDVAMHAYAEVPSTIPSLLAAGTSIGTMRYFRRVNNEARPLIFTKDLLTYTLQHNHDEGVKDVHSISPLRSAFSSTSSQQTINTEIRTRKSPLEAVQGANHAYTALATFPPIQSNLRKRK
ncbi:hypothetical protein [Parendozoicomonas haliclonae]|uniref:Uncharacterized protein n=1 Tax=Parendozoicomonas haliclonae TaxID=1960125 RepID=A0A1X7AMA1_9GAMM|nr:hypothetical protein [Parendozoicomonas haliclonae]SMA49076.1 hypothetical protein EHSB41UT_03037 [Parendozoicomonas haliclonae]